LPCVGGGEVDAQGEGEFEHLCLVCSGIGFVDLCFPRRSRHGALEQVMLFGLESSDSLELLRVRLLGHTSKFLMRRINERGFAS
jgi:hypothetical protein